MTEIKIIPPIVEAISDTYIVYRYGTIPEYVVKAENELRALQMVCTHAGYTTGDLEQYEISLKKIKYGEVEDIYVRGPIG